MSNVQYNSLDVVLGIPDPDDTQNLEFTTSTVSASGITCSGSQVYRFAADQDVAFYLSETNDGAITSTNASFLFGGQPEVFQMPAANQILVASGLAASGRLRISRMRRRGEQ